MVIKIWLPTLERLLNRARHQRRLRKEWQACAHSRGPQDIRPAIEFLEDRTLLFGALQLDGVNDYATVPDHPSLDLGVGVWTPPSPPVEADDFTIETFFYVPDPQRTGAQTFFYKANAYFLFHNSSFLGDYLFFRLDSSPAPFDEVTIQAAVDLTFGWHHVAAVFDNEFTSTSDSMALYLDGFRLAVGTGVDWTPGINNSTAALNVGGANGVSSFHGFFDEMRISNRVRYTGSIYTVPTGPFVTDAFTRGLWHFEETPGSTTFANASGAGNSLSGINGAQTATSPSNPFPNRDPELTSGTTPSVAENTTSVLTVTATDADLPAQTVKFSITGGVDEAKFSITSGGVLTFVAAPDFEAPTDADTNNSYLVQVSANDGNGGTAVQNLLVSVTAANDNNPVFSSSATPIVAENTTSVPTVIVADADLPAQTVTFSITAGADRNKFSISSSGTLNFVTDPDFEAPADANGDNVYLVQVTANDGNGRTAVQNLSVTVAAVNDHTPTILSAATPSVAENTIAVITVKATDADRPAQPLIFSTVGGADAAKFSITSDGVLTFNSPPSFDAPTDSDSDNDYVVLVQVSDGSRTATQEIHATVMPTPDIVLNSVTANGTTRLILQYQILNVHVTSPFSLRFLRSTDTMADDADTVLSTVTITNAADLEVGSHTLNFTIGSQVLLPGAGKPEVGTDYFILAVADPANSIIEADSDPLNEDNTVAFVGAYATTTTIYAHGGAADDVVALTYPSSTSGNVSLGLAGTLTATYFYVYNQTTAFRLRTQGGDDVVNIVTSSLSARPMLELGGDGHDVLTGAAGADTLNGGAGDDTLSGGRGSDSLNGGSGGNTLVETGNVSFTLTNTSLSGLGTDRLANLQIANLTGGTNDNNFTASGWTGTGHFVGSGGMTDTIVVSKNADFMLSNSSLQTSDGFNVVLNGFSKATLTGGVSSNTFVVSAWTGTGSLNGSSRSDLDKLFVVRDLNMTLTNKLLATAGFGNLTLTAIETASLTGGAGSNTLDASTFSGSVTLQGGDGDDVLNGGSGNDVLNGDDGNDTIKGGAGKDTIDGGSGNDKLRGGDADDSILGGLGNDLLSGDAGHDMLDGNDGDDSILGGAGNDQLFGGIGADHVFGQDGNDALNGGADADSLSGGAGSNTTPDFVAELDSIGAFSAELTVLLAALP